MRHQERTEMQGCFGILMSWIISGVGLVAGIWIGLDIALAGDIARGVGLGLAIVAGSGILAAIVGFFGIALLSR